MDRTRQPTPYDLTQPPPLRPGERAAARNAGRVAATAFSSLASEYLGREVRVTLQDVGGNGSAADGREAADSLWVVAQAADEVRCPVWRFDRDLALWLVDTMTGYRPAADPREGYALSRIEGRLLALLCRELQGGWVATWPAAAVAVSPLRCIPGTMDLTSPCPREWVRLTFDVRSEPAQGTFDLFMPVELVRQLASRPAHEPAGVPATAPGGVRLSPVTATVRLGTWRTTLRELTAAEPGQVVPLGRPVEAPLELSVGKVARVPVRPGMSNGRIAVQVTGRPVRPD